MTFDKRKMNIHLQHPDQANNTNLMQTSRYSLNFPGEQPEKDRVPFAFQHRLSIPWLLMSALKMYM